MKLKSMTVANFRCYKSPFQDAWRRRGQSAPREISLAQPLPILDGHWLSANCLEASKGQGQLVGCSVIS